MAQIVVSSLLELIPGENLALPVSCHGRQSTGLSSPTSQGFLVWQKDSLLDGVLGKTQLMAFPALFDKRLRTALL